MKKENFLIAALLLISVLTFFFFGLYHLGKFETTDEYLWKYTRIPQYWDALKSQDWGKTYINDKPGVSVALFSGLGLLSEPDPRSHRLMNSEITKNNTFSVYDTARSEKINLALRLPILILNALFLFFFFWIVLKITRNKWLALLFIIFLSFSPVILGISQIINPDAFLWTFSAASLFSYLALLEKKEKKFLALSGVFMGLALLSKYTANILFPFYIFLLFFKYIFEQKEILARESAKKYFSREIVNFFAIAAISVLTFSIFLPAVFIKPVILYKNTLGFSGFKLVIWPMLAAILFILFDALTLGSKMTNFLTNSVFKNKLLLTRLVCLALLLIFAFIIINSLLDQKIIPFEDYRDKIYSSGKGGFGKLLKKEPFIPRISQKWLLEFHPLVFSIPFVPLVLIFFLWAKTALGKNKKHLFYIFSFSLFIPLFLTGAYLSKVETNVRYSLMLYPLIFFLATLSFSEFQTLAEKLKFSSQKIFLLGVAIALAAGFVSLWKAKPHYFTYSNFLLPEKFYVSDAWGYGSYEAAAYLNSLPNAKNLTIWSNRSGICQFFIGHCIKSQSINLEKAVPDYFVLTRRGELKNRFSWKNPELSKKNPNFYYDKLTDEYAWSLFINDRPGNYVKIIKSEEK